MDRRQLLGAVASLPVLPDAADSEGSTAEDSTANQPLPLEACFGTVNLLFHDEAVDLQVTTGERWTGSEFEPVADLRLRLDGGEVTVTLSETDVRALVNELEPVFEEH